MSQYNSDTTIALSERPPSQRLHSNATAGMISHDSYESPIMNSTAIEEPNVQLTDVDQGRTQTNVRALYSVQNNAPILRTHTDAENDGPQISQLSQHVDSVSTSLHGDGRFAIVFPYYASSPPVRPPTLPEAVATRPGQFTLLDDIDLEWQSTVSGSHQIGALQLDDTVLGQSPRSGASQFQDFMSFDPYTSNETSVVSHVRKKR